MANSFQILAPLCLSLILVQWQHCVKATSLDLPLVRAVSAPVKKSNYQAVVLPNDEYIISLLSESYEAKLLTYSPSTEDSQGDLIGPNLAVTGQMGGVKLLKISPNSQYIAILFDSGTIVVLDNKKEVIWSTNLISNGDAVVCHSIEILSSGNVMCFHEQTILILEYFSAKPALEIKEQVQIVLRQPDTDDVDYVSNDSLKGFVFGYSLINETHVFAVAQPTPGVTDHSLFQAYFVADLNLGESIVYCEERFFPEFLFIQKGHWATPTCEPEKVCSLTIVGYTLGQDTNVIKMSGQYTPKSLYQPAQLSLSRMSLFAFDVKAASESMGLSYLTATSVIIATGDSCQVLEWTDGSLQDISGTGTKLFAKTGSDLSILDVVMNSDKTSGMLVTLLSNPKGQYLNLIAINNKCQIIPSATTDATTNSFSTIDLLSQIRPGSSPILQPITNSLTKTSSLSLKNTPHMIFTSTPTPLVNNYLPAVQLSSPPAILPLKTDKTIMPLDLSFISAELGMENFAIFSGSGDVIFSPKSGEIGTDFGDLGGKVVMTAMVYLVRIDFVGVGQGLKVELYFVQPPLGGRGDDGGSLVKFFGPRTNDVVGKKIVVNHGGGTSDEFGSVVITAGIPTIDSSAVVLQCNLQLDILFTGEFLSHNPPVSATMIPETVGQFVYGDFTGVSIGRWFMGVIQDPNQECSKFVILNLTIICVSLDAATAYNMEGQRVGGIKFVFPTTMKETEMTLQSVAVVPGKDQIVCVFTASSENTEILIVQFSSKFELLYSHAIILPSPFENYETIAENNGIVSAFLLKSQSQDGTTQVVCTRLNDEGDFQSSQVFKFPSASTSLTLTLERYLPDQYLLRIDNALYILNNDMIITKGINIEFSPALPCVANDIAFNSVARTLFVLTTCDYKYAPVQVPNPLPSGTFLSPLMVIKLNSDLQLNAESENAIVSVRLVDVPSSVSYTTMKMVAYEHETTLEQDNINQTTLNSGAYTGAFSWDVSQDLTSFTAPHSRDYGTILILPEKDHTLNFGLKPEAGECEFSLPKSTLDWQHLTHETAIPELYLDPDSSIRTSVQPVVVNQICHNYWTADLEVKITVPTVYRRTDEKDGFPIGWCFLLMFGVAVLTVGAWLVYLKFSGKEYHPIIHKTGSEDVDRLVHQESMKTRKRQQLEDDHNFNLQPKIAI